MYSWCRVMERAMIVQSRQVAGRVRGFASMESLLAILDDSATGLSSSAVSVAEQSQVMKARRMVVWASQSLNSSPVVEPAPTSPASVKRRL
jgi:hypothetical protein